MFNIESLVIAVKVFPFIAFCHSCGEGMLGAAAESDLCDECYYSMRGCTCDMSGGPCPAHECLFCFYIYPPEQHDCSHPDKVPHYSGTQFDCLCMTCATGRKGEDW